MKKKVIVGTFSLLTSFFISSVISPNEVDAAYYENVPHTADQWEYRTDGAAWLMCIIKH